MKKLKSLPMTKQDKKIMKYLKKNLDDCYMECDKEFFEKNIDKKFFVRLKMGDENITHSDYEFIVVYQIVPGIRIRVGFNKNNSLEEIKKQCYNIEYIFYNGNIQ